ncbi:MAG: aldo/keto reductase [Polyangia bacterium]
MMETRALGATGLRVSALGFGAGPFGRTDLAEADAERLLSAAIDLGITLIDTARSYDLSEERIGRYLGGRRAHVVLSSKGGYGIDGVADWSAAAVTGGIEAALARLRTDWIDVFHFHSCGLDVLWRDELFEALDRARAAGKIRVAAYSGEGAPLAWALDSGRFASLQCSVSPFDQHSLGAIVPAAATRGVGVIAKRPLGNAPWRAVPRGEPEAQYRARMERMEIDPSPFGFAELCLRFAAFSPGVSCAIAGTTNVGHLAENVAALARGPLPDEAQTRVRAAFAQHDRGWTGVV